MKPAEVFCPVLVSLLILLPPLNGRANAASTNESFTLEERIEKAVHGRNYIFSTLLPDSTDLDITAWSNTLKQNITATLQLNPSENVWRLFINGMLLHFQNNDGGNSFLESSLQHAENSPGTTWLLFFEFNRYGMTSWVESSLMQLEKQLFTAGGLNSSFISRQLLHLGNINKANGKKAEALLYYKWSHRFDARETASLRKRLTLGSPFDLNEKSVLLGDYLATINGSWTAQLALIHFWFNVIKFFFILFIFFTVASLSIKYFPQALHGVSHLYSDKVPLWMKTLLISAIIVSTVSFGGIPFIWLAAFLIWKYCEKNEKVLLGIVLACVLVSPFISDVQSRLQNALNPDGVIMELSTASEEGFPAVGKSITETNVSDKNTDLPKQLSLTFHAIKHHDLAMAEQLVTPLAATYPSDPVVACVQGIVLFLKGSIQSAAEVFKSITDADPSDYTAMFNLARCYIMSNNASEGMQLIEQAARLKNKKISRFIQDNDFYFENKWPPLRQIMFPTYTPKQFWKLLFMRSTSDKEYHRLLWGLSFFGIPPFISFIMFCVLLVILSMVNKHYQQNKKIRRQFNCKYCGRTVCRKCTSGVLCDSCSSKITYVKGTQSVESVRKHIMDIFSYSKSVRNTLFSLLLPGFGDLLYTKSNHIGMIITMVLTTLVYTLWFAVIRSCSFRWMHPVEIFILLIFPVLFHSYFLVRFLPQLFNHINNIFMLFSQKKDSN